MQKLDTKYVPNVSYNIYIVFDTQVFKCRYTPQIKLTSNNDSASQTKALRFKSSPPGTFDQNGGSWEIFEGNGADLA